MIYAISLGALTAIWLVIVVLNERRGLLAADRFPNRAAKYFAYAWLLAFLLLIGLLVTGAALSPARATDLAKMPFYSLFALHAVLVVFLAVWWLAAGRPSLRRYLHIRTENLGEAVAAGIVVGLAGWAATIAGALVVAMILKNAGLITEPTEMPVMVSWMASQPAWKKVLIILSAMTVEEFFFRSWLQSRIGLLASTALFAVAHFTLGQPLLLIGITVISLVIGFAFYRTKNVIPGIVAHGVFDAIQLFVIIPFAVKMLS
jgi:membrane protease YdiL (CAAX protease family)